MWSSDKSKSPRDDSTADADRPGLFGRLSGALKRTRGALLGSLLLRGDPGLRRGDPGLELRLVRFPLGEGNDSERVLNRAAHENDDDQDDAQGHFVENVPIHRPAP